jgi:hypothetical protein
MSLLSHATESAQRCAQDLSAPWKAAHARQAARWNALRAELGKDPPWPDESVLDEIEREIAGAIRAGNRFHAELAISQWEDLWL